MKKFSEESMVKQTIQLENGKNSYVYLKEDIKKAIDFLFENLYESWMSENDRKYLREDLLKFTGKTEKSLIEDLAEGAKNGHSLESQIEILYKYGFLE